MARSNSLAVVPTYVRDDEELRVTLKTVETLRRQEPDLDVFVVDDCSPYEDKWKLDTACQELAVDHVLMKDENEGFSHTVNYGMREALETGQNVILVNADIEFVRPFVEIFEEQRDSQDRLAAVVGALLLYPNGLIQHAGVYLCQPAGELVATSKHGQVPIEELDPSVHGLISYARSDNRIFRGATGAGRWSEGWKPSKTTGGYPFRVTSRPYSGHLIEITTDAGSAFVTPNHKLTAFWRDDTLRSNAVYLMKRGNNWRIGQCAMRHGKNVFGPRMRMLQEDADAVWILKTNMTKDEAVQEEAYLSWKYGIPTWPFLLSKSTRTTRGATSQESLEALWMRVDTDSGAKQALRDHQRWLDHPIDHRREFSGVRRDPIGAQRRHPIRAGALMADAMLLPTDPGTGQTPRNMHFQTASGAFSGDVYSMEVHPHEHYVTNNIIVHNSFYERAFDHKYRYAPGALPEAHDPAICPVTGALQFIRHSTLEQVGIYDEEFRMGFEDVDYCLRTFEAGLECVYQPDVVAIHHESLFRGQRSEHLDEWHAQSARFLREKHGTTPLGRYILPIA